MIYLFSAYCGQCGAGILRGCSIQRPDSSVLQGQSGENRRPVTKLTNTGWQCFYTE